METNVIKTPETHTDELINALKLITEIVNGPELRTIKEFIRTTDEARQVDLSNLEQTMETALAKIREDAMAISADLRHTKADMETDRKKWDKEITNAVDQMHKTSKDTKQKLGATETTLRTSLSKIEDQIETSVSDLTQKHAQRFTNIESRVTRCENESTSRREENNRLALSLSNAAQSLVTAPTKIPSPSNSSMKQIDNILTELDDGEPEVKDKKSGKNEMPDFDAVLNAKEK